MSHRRLNEEAVIALPAIKHGIGKIHLGEQHTRATLDSLKDLIDSRKNLLEYGLTPVAIDSIRNNVQFNVSSLLLKRDEHSYTIIFDEEHNFINSLAEWWSNGVKNTFVHIVSPPYLLRDYMAHHREFFLENVEKISPFVPELSRTTWSMTYLLIERLCNGVMKQEELISNLQKVRNKPLSKEPIIEQLNQFLRQVLKTEQDFKPFIEIVEEESFTVKKFDFNKTIYYKLSRDFYQELIPNWFEFFELKTSTNEVIDEIIAGNIYQNYLPGQLHAFNGNLYRIEDINRYTKTIDLVYEAQTEKYQYHQNRSFAVKGPLDEEAKYATEQLMIDQNEVMIQLYQCEVEASTNGYFQFDHGIDLADEKLRYTKLSYQDKEIYDRNYPNGNVLEFKWKIKNDSAINVEQVSVTLVYLLNEIFVSLFPHGYQYLAATTSVPENYFPEEQAFYRNLKRYLPKVKDVPEDEENMITIYIFEDTPLQMGMLERIKDKWLHLFEIMEDYMYWLSYESEQEPKQCFAYMGGDSMPEVFQFEETMEAIRSLLPENRLHTQRQLATENQQETEQGEKRQCDFCKNYFAATEFIQLDDERERCSVCHQTAIDRVEDLTPLYEEVRTFFTNTLQVEVRQNIHIKMINAKEIQALSGQKFVPTEEYDARIVGTAIRSGERAEIYIENGAPRLQTLATLAHELTHIWQFDQLNLDVLTLADLEGHASWVEVYFMESIGAYKEAEILNHELLHRDDVYGEGYRKVLQQLEGYSHGATPFDFYER
ncbi:hypothetical protein [Ornithinibacillus halophilus]|uniref:Uncharacterized protein n=1 Tax=Ornithinibacillus halophilus TaxID=930117 RepID=A0A1M5GQY6_9BACI|nr:hypothetical protein [Ornithinibacillus halophilus]SHG06093.1 hypothetical protein SAMN05216225_101418 [Ornithinibacillus halophilus]